MSLTQDHSADLVRWRGLSDFFKKKRKRGLSYHTIQGFIARGMPHVHEGHNRLFDCEVCWKWYLEEFSVAA